VAFPSGPPQGAPATTGRNEAKLLDVNVDQLPGPVSFVTADRLPAGPIDVVQPVEPFPDQHPMHGGGRDSEPAADLHRADLLLQPQMLDLADQRRAGRPGTPTRARRVVGHVGDLDSPDSGQGGP
jgi:hypothetical protein